MSLSFIKQETKSGFTLIELLVVIAIIGVLASIVLASLNTARRKSRDARRISDIKQIQLALELFYDAQSPSPRYPTAVDNIPGNCNTTTAYGLEALATAANAFIPQVPRDPQGGCYLYATRGAPATTYHLAATLEEATNAALNSDKDCASNVTDGCSIGAAYIGGFDGGVTIPDTTNRRYDVIP